MYRVYNNKLPLFESNIYRKNNSNECAGEIQTSRTIQSPVECLQNILKLPRINTSCKSYDIDIEDDDFIIKYFENKDKIKLKYRQKSFIKQ